MAIAIRALLRLNSKSFRGSFLRQNRAVWTLVIGLTCVFWGNGCQRKPSDLPTTSLSEIEAESTTKTAAAQVSPPSNADLPVLESVDAAGLEAWVLEQRGSVVLVDCWALWCLNCLEEMPTVLTWQKRWKEKGLVVASLNFDSPGDEEKRREAAIHLRDLGAEVKAFQSSVTPGSKAMDEFAINEGLPHYRLYDRDGTLVSTFNGATVQLEEQLARLLESPSSTSGP